MTTNNRVYLHPVTLTTAYVDNKPNRDPYLMLAPKPDTIFFNSTDEAEAWATGRGIEIIPCKDKWY